MSLRIKKFDPRGIKEHRIIFLIGKRHTGKSRLMLDLLSQMPAFDFAMAFAPTDDTIETFRTFLPSSCVYSNFSHDKLERLLSLQRELIRRGKKRSVLLILDDCLYQKNTLKSTAMRDLFFNGRHLHVSMICAAQYCMDVEASVRANIDYVMTMRDSTITNRQKLHKNFFGQFERFAEFDKVMAACTQNYSSLIMDATVPSTVATECVFWYRASLDIAPFKLVKPIMYHLSEKCARSDSEILRAQSRQFDIEHAKGGGGGQTSQPKVAVVQIEDENGQVIVST